MAEHNAKARNFYESIHWGNESRGLLNLDQYTLLPEWTAALGRPERLSTPAIDPSASRLKKGWLLVDPGPRRELFIVGVGAPRVQGLPQGTLPQIAGAAGGRRARLPYPNVMAVDLGPVFHIDYATQKGGDEPILYMHEMLDRGEGKQRARVRPHLAFAQGVYFFVGGDYTVTAHGIVG